MKSVLSVTLLLMFVSCGKTPDSMQMGSPTAVRNARLNARFSFSCDGKVFYSVSREIRSEPGGAAAHGGFNVSDDYYDNFSTGGSEKTLCGDHADRTFVARIFRQQSVGGHMLLGLGRIPQPEQICSSYSIPAILKVGDTYECKGLRDGIGFELQITISPLSP